MNDPVKIDIQNLKECLATAKENAYQFIDVKYNDAGSPIVCGIYQFIFTVAIISDITPTGYDGRWCYVSMIDAMKALENWSGVGEPDCWHRHPDTGRRRDEKGAETINF